jgi:hypothetical protein
MLSKLTGLIDRAKRTRSSQNPIISTLFVAAHPPRPRFQLIAKDCIALHFRESSESRSRWVCVLGLAALSSRIAHLVAQGFYPSDGLEVVQQ